MPRATVTPIQAQGSNAVEFFRKAPLELADFVFGLCRAALKERKDKSADAKERAVASGITKNPKAKMHPQNKAAVKAKPGPKKKAKKKAAKRTGPVGLPTPGSAQDTVGPTVPASTQSEPVGAQA